MECELDGVLRLECFLILLPYLDDGRHVDLIESRQQCRILLRLDEPLGNTAPDGRHRNDFFLATARTSSQWRFARGFLGVG